MELDVSCAGVVGFHDLLHALSPARQLDVKQRAHEEGAVFRCDEPCVGMAV